MACVEILSTSDTRKSIERIGKRAVAIEADLSYLESIDKMISTTKEAFGKIDILFNNAGIIRRAPIAEYTEKSGMM